MTQTAKLPYNFTVVPPTMKDLLDTFKQDLMINFNCHHIASIKTFDPINQTCTAEMVYKRTYFNIDPNTKKYVPVQIPYAVLVDCPVICLSGGLTSLTFPIQPGDECLVLFNDRDIDNWFSGSSNTGVATPRLHSFSDGLILVGVKSLANVLDNYDSVRAILRAGNVINSIVAIGVNPITGRVLITNRYPGNAITLNTLLQQLIANIQQLVTATASITVSGVTSGIGTSGVPVNAAAITAAGTALSTTASQIAGMLE